MNVNDRNGIGLCRRNGVLADVITQSNIAQRNVAGSIDQSALRRGGIKLTNAMNYLNITRLTSRARQVVAKAITSLNANQSGST